MKRINVAFFFILSAALIFFDVYKAIHTAFTYDECVTFLGFVPQSIMEILSYRKTTMANNHILNTLLVKLFEACFGDSEIALRLPNILAHILYLFATYKLFIRYDRFFIPFFILANANPYLIDFFSLARGYGLSIGLMSMGFYQYTKYLGNKKSLNQVLALIFLGVSTLANFTMINIYLIFILVHNIFIFFIYQTRFTLKNFWSANAANGIVTILFFLVLYEPIRVTIQHKLIIVGGHDGFWNDTVNSLLRCLAYFQSYEKSFVFLMQVFVVAFSILFLIRIGTYFSQKDKLNSTAINAPFFGMILFLIVVTSILQNVFWEIPFVMSRFALFIYPIFIVMCCFLLADLLARYKRLNIPLTLVAAAFLVHTCYSLNVTWYYEWRQMTVLNTKKMLIDLNQKAASTGKHIRLGCTWIYEPILNFYRIKLNLTSIDPVYEYGITYLDDFFVTDDDDSKKIPEKEKNVIDHEPVLKNYVVRHVNADNFKPLKIKAANRKYLSDDQYNLNNVFASREKTTLWETFAIEKLENNFCAIRAYNYSFLSAQLNNQNKVVASGKELGPWETFELISVDSSHVAFKAANGKYLSVDESINDGQLSAIGDSIGSLEKFELQLVH